MNDSSSGCPLVISTVKLLSDETLQGIPSRDFFKQLKFSPDGLKILASTENNYLKSWDVNKELVNSVKYYCSSDEALETVQTYSNTASSPSSISCGESIYDFEWYPFMNTNLSSSCCFITTSRDHPIHLRDDIQKTIRCSYSCYDAMDELEAANSVTFNLSGDKIYAGSNRMIRCFDLANPGRTCVSKPTCKSRKDPSGQRGIISCLKFNPDYSGAYAAGSYAHNITIYAENIRESVLELDNLEFGVTCLRWSPCGNMLWAGGRAHSDLICWDLRTTRSELGRVRRTLDSNQRISFDLDPWGKYLATGSQDGKILLYDAATFNLVKTVTNNADVTGDPSGNENVREHRKRQRQVEAKDEVVVVNECQGTFDEEDRCVEDLEPKAQNWTEKNNTRVEGSVCVNSVAFHPYCALLISTTGEREFDYDGSVSDCESESESDGDGESSQAINTSSSSGSDNCTKSCENKVKMSNLKTLIKKRDLLSRSSLQVWAIDRSPIVLPSVAPIITTEADSQIQTLEYDSRSLDNIVDTENYEFRFDSTETALSSGSMRKQFENISGTTKITQKNDVENLKNIIIQEAIEKSIELSQSKFDLLDCIETDVEMPG